MFLLAAGPLPNLKAEEGQGSRHRPQPEDDHEGAAEVVEGQGVGRGPRFLEKNKNIPPRSKTCGVCVQLWKERDNVVFASNLKLKKVSL